MAGGLKESGGVLLSHRGNPAVPSAQHGFTSVFGMDTGGSHALSPPKNVAGRHKAAGVVLGQLNMESSLRFIHFAVPLFLRGKKGDD